MKTISNSKNVTTTKEDKFILKILENLDSVDSNDWEKYTNYKMQIPKNLFNKKSYKGFNILTLFLDTLVKGFKSSYYASFNSIAKANGKLKKGAKGVNIEFFSYFYKNSITKKTYSEEEVRCLKSDELKNIVKIPCIKNYIVFNSELIENFEELDLNIQIDEVEELFFLEKENCENFLNDIINFGNLNLKYAMGDIAFYNPILDFIQIPERKIFISEDKFYATIFHEIIHWTGNVNRLNRELKGHNDVLSYSFEELIAEMGSMLICLQFGITSEFINSVRYLKGWSNINKNNRVEKIREAFSHSKKAKKYLEKLK